MEVTGCGRRVDEPWLHTEGGQRWSQTEDWQWPSPVRQHSPPPPQPSLLPSLSSTDLVQTWDESWLQIHGVKILRTPDEQDWLQTQTGRHWLQTQAGCHWLQTQAGRGWLQTHSARKCLQTSGGREWPQTRSGGSWLLTLHGRRWLQTPSGEDWLQTHGGQDWLQTQCGQDWLQILGGENWLQTEGGRDWLQIEGGRRWLQADGGRKWLQAEAGRDWLENQGGRDWLQTPHGQAWQLNTTWVTVEEFSRTLEALREYIFAPDMRLHPAFEVVQQFKSLPDFLMFPAFLALRPQDHFPQVSSHGHLPPGIEIIDAMKVFSSFAYEAREESQSASDVLNYACQNWVVHLSRAPNPWDESLSHIFQSFWGRNLLSWLTRQWCLKGLRSCLTILSEGGKIARQHHLQISGSSQQPA
ncbi:uncharacterized protein HD556DRAFT_977503 [Suillus plorans]|uniref:Uncharacterized protein n=1 Tax=Suillus plorans TaxID=116603 RepID=A0A9P7DR34_9AGAM|nr:uncharacterized protein HD556DRAFT_977503 [Suillus plorans]KAG1801020.1 hypothetical protein HD556DRAFT_977503 [Suillus plorans]